MPFSSLLQAFVPDSHKCCMSLPRAWGEERTHQEEEEKGVSAGGEALVVNRSRPGEDAAWP